MQVNSREVEKLDELLTTRHRIFLLSPANINGIRASLVTRDAAEFELARQLRGAGVSLGELFSFISGLYFRGKLTYARAFATPPPAVAGVFVITAGGGLVPPDTLVTRERLHEFSSADVDLEDVRYRAPLERDARRLAELAGTQCEFVLLGSIATPKYVEPLLEVFHERLVFPAEFVGRGDMSRGGLLLRAVEAQKELAYRPVLGAIRHGKKPPKLERLARRRTNV